MDEDRAAREIALGRQARTIEAPLKEAADKVKEALAKHLLTCKAEEMEHTRRLYHSVDQIIVAFNTIINDGTHAERILNDIQTGRHRAFAPA